MKLRGNCHLRKRIYIITLLFVFCHIAFDLLDLDLSNFRLKAAPRENATAITSEAPEAAELVKAVEADGFRTQPVLVLPPVSHDPSGIHQKELVMKSRTRRIRTVFRPLVIPHSAADSSPAA